MRPLRDWIHERFHVRFAWNVSCTWNRTGVISPLLQLCAAGPWRSNKFEHSPKGIFVEFVCCSTIPWVCSNIFIYDQRYVHPTTGHRPLCFIYKSHLIALLKENNCLTVVTRPFKVNLVKKEAFRSRYLLNVTHDLFYTIARNVGHNACLTICRHKYSSAQ
jgi:hypothetical protein